MFSFFRRNGDQDHGPVGREGGARLELVDLTKVYGESVIAADRVSINIEPGEFITLLGPSGSGKTTTLMMIAGFVIPTSGEVLVDGQDIAFRPPHKRNVGMVFQNYALFPHMTVADNIGFPLKMRRWSKSDINTAVSEVLRLVQLPTHGDRFPRQLSGGQQQRIALARALVFRPPVLLMDEPLGALDKKLREEMQLEIKHIQQETNITTVYVTHDQGEALTMSDRIAVMQDGWIEQIGSPTELYERPINKFVADFIGESNFISGTVVRDGERATMKTEDDWSLPLPENDGRSEGSFVEVAIRPERLAIGEGEGEIRAEGTVEEIIYFGETTKARVKLKTGPELIIKTQNRGSEGNWERGDTVPVWWNAGDMVVLQPDDQSMAGYSDESLEPTAAAAS
jgi:putative spermidine/putrescine transport system ATP-binding protein